MSCVILVANHKDKKGIVLVQGIDSIELLENTIEKSNKSFDVKISKTLSDINKAIGVRYICKAINYEYRWYPYEIIKEKIEHIENILINGKHKEYDVDGIRNICYGGLFKDLFFGSRLNSTLYRIKEGTFEW